MFLKAYNTYIKLYENFYFSKGIEIWSKKFRNIVKNPNSLVLQVVTNKNNNVTLIVFI